MRIGGLHDDVLPVDDQRSAGRDKTFITTGTLRHRHLSTPRRSATSARRLHLHLPARWPWAQPFFTMLDAIRAVALVT